MVLRLVHIMTMALFLATTLAAPLVGCAAAPGAVALDGRRVDPFAEGDGVTVLLFLTTQCPIANRYAPEISRIHDAFAAPGTAFWRVYADAADTPDDIAAHARDYGLGFPALRDPDHVLVRRAGATVTPEVAVFEGGTLVYRGRIDDRFVDFGQVRPAATVRDLQDVLATLRAGRTLELRTTTAIGCFIPERAES